ncbi:MAG TPA: DUF4162 domain-containing protein, partial [Phototrophicaceae bacterium]|nr:DUF4162 domain-containing protein [Phototrophicaceae bacterium]
LADRIAIIDGGQIRVEGQPAELKSALGSESINVTFKDVESVEQAKTELSEMFTKVQVDRKTLRLYRNNVAEVVAAVVNRLNAHGLTPVTLTLTTPTLDDVFLQVTGQRLEEETAQTATAGSSATAKGRFGRRRSA